ncbi:DUF1499 domain-containing protein [Bermanella sp. R86510]|uniref:DUF1499 domain-containing protein n=1 Tax=unclassified Bermanella TaxID=2627862 RepID=UPI0037CA0387
MIKPITALLLVTLVSACANQPPSNLGIQNGALAPCPSTPNCVSSMESKNNSAHIPPLQPRGTETLANLWEDLIQTINSKEQAKIIKQNSEYLHAEFSSRFFGFVDDVEFYRNEPIIQVRSASRVGYSDLGVNRNRVEAIRKELQQLP